MEEPLLPRKPWKDPQALQKRLEQAAEAMRREEAKVRRVSGWATLGFALALGVISGCTPTSVYGGPPPNLRPTPSASSSATPSLDERPAAEVYGAPRAEATPIINQQPSGKVYGAPRSPKDRP